jgi:hypothetical protein
MINVQGLKFIKCIFPVTIIEGFVEITSINGSDRDYSLPLQERRDLDKYRS